MSYCRTEGKDKLIFVTEEDHSESSIKLPPLDEQPGLITPTGEINWACPCLGGMATGPCGVEFREAFTCFHYSAADPKGSDCFEKFSEMQQCMTQYPEVYGAKDNNDDDDDEGEDAVGRTLNALEEETDKKTENNDSSEKTNTANKK